MSREHAVAAVALIVAAYPRQEFPPASQKLYVEMLADLDGPLLIAAVKDYVTQGTFLPSIAELRNAAYALTAQAAGLLDAYSAWEKVTVEIRHTGYHRTPELDELTMQAVRSVGGWRNLCMSENIVADRARFIDAYEIFLRREQVQAVRLPGVAQLVEGMSATRKLGQGGEELDGADMRPGARR